MKRLMSYFLRGIVFLVPIGLTVWLLFGAVHSVDSWARDQLRLPFPGLGVVVTIVAITFVGFLASNLLTKRLVHALERIIDRLPVVKLLHGSVKDVLSAFVGDERRFDKPVVVSMNPHGTVKALGFITRDNVEAFQLVEHVAVYFPQAYNFAGQVVLVPRTAVTLLDMPSSDVMTFIVSGGISGK
ncbi:MAG: DUF502 domain-containing protein [Myxococcales bacterium]|nr:DUF502 domain-containing protein [Myxococcales bacterium]